MVTHDGHRIFVREQEPAAGAPILALHGFPSSSYDWRQLCDLLSGRRLTTFDFLGFGLSEKPRGNVYSLFAQADLTEAIATACCGGEAVTLVAHDMGTSVATELMARDLEHKLSFRLGAVLLFNGSMVLERASLTPGQKLLRGPLGPLATRLTSELTFRAQFRRLFSAAHPISSAELADQWALLSHRDGHRILDRLIYYLHERTVHAPRWHGALRDWPGHLELAWAGQDPVCTEAVLQAVRELRPHAPLTRLSELGHYPQLEDPSACAATVRRVAEAST